MDDLMTIGVTLFIVILLSVFTFVDLHRFNRAFNKMREGIWRGILPLCFCAAYEVIFIALGFNSYSALIFIYFGLNAAIAVILWNTEYFYAGVLHLPSLGRTICVLHFNISTFQEVTNKTLSFDANLYKFKDECTTFREFAKVIDETDMLKKIEAQFKTKQEQTKYKQWLKSYDEFKEKPEKYRVTVLGYYDISEIFRGYKKLIYIHETDEALELIEGNCIKLFEKKLIAQRKHEIIICLAGKRVKEISQHLQTSPTLLEVFSNLPMLEMYPALLAYNAKLQTDNQRLLRWMEKFKSQESITNNALTQDLPGRDKGKEPQELQTANLFKYLLLSFVALAVTVFAFLFLIIFGVI